MVREGLRDDAKERASTVDDAAPPTTTTSTSAAGKEKLAADYSSSEPSGAPRAAGAAMRTSRERGERIWRARDADAVACPGGKKASIERES